VGEQEETQQQEEEGQTYVSSPGHYTAGDDFTRDQETRNTHHEADDDDDDELLDDSLLESLNLTTSGGPMQSTPKRAKEEEPEWADMESPFDALAKELTMKYGSPERPPPQQQERQNFFSAGSSSSSMLPPPSTPPRNRRHSTPESSPFRAPPVARTPGIENDRVMHRVQNKNWRIQATPLRSAMKSRYRTVTAATPKQPPLFSRNNNARILDPSSPLDSPPEPQLHTQIFTPGVLRTPGAKRIDAEVKGAAAKYMYDDDSDDDLFLPPGFSPPKTIQFSLPASKLMATPAREASRKIVRDILQTAGASVDGTMTTVESSPMRGGRMDEDETF
jgi:DASH complex subunit ASK1